MSSCEGAYLITRPFIGERPSGVHRGSKRHIVRRRFLPPWCQTANVSVLDVATKLKLIPPIAEQCQYK